MNDCTPTCPNADFWRFGRNSFIKDTVVAPQDVTLGYGNFWFGTGYIVCFNDKKTDFWPSFTTWMTSANWINTLFSWFWFYTPMMVVDVPCRKSLEWIWCWTRRWRYGCARWIQIQVWAILTKKLLGDVRYRCPSYHHHGDLVKFPYQKKVGMNLVAKSWCFFSDLLMFLWVEFGEKKTLVESTWRSFTRRFWDPQIRTTSSLAIKKKANDRMGGAVCKRNREQGSFRITSRASQGRFCNLCSTLELSQMVKPTFCQLQNLSQACSKAISHMHTSLFKVGVWSTHLPKKWCTATPWKSRSSKWRGPSCSLKLNSSSCPHDPGDVVWPDWLLLLEMKMMRSSW